MQRCLPGNVRFDQQAGIKKMFHRDFAGSNQIIDARLLIEPHIAGQAALHANDADLKKFEALFEDSASHFDDPVQLKKNNLEFHLLLAREPANRDP